MRITTFAAAALIAALPPASPLAAGSAEGSDLAKRTFQNAEQLMAEGKSDQALKAYQQIIQSFSERPLVGEAELEKRNYDRAILSFERSLEGAPHGPVAAESQYLLGLANVRLGDFVRAAEAFQGCRTEDEKSGSASRALDWLTLVYKLRLAPAAGAAIDYSHDSGFIPRLPAGEDFRGEIGLAVAPAGELLVADPRRGGLLSLPEDRTRI